MLPRLQSLAVGQTLQTIPASGGAPFSAILGTVLADVNNQTAFLSAYAENGDRPIEEFWQNLRAQPAFANQVDKIQFVLQLGVLTHSHLPLIQALQNNLKVTSIRDLLKLNFDRLDQFGQSANHRCSA